MRSIVKSIRIKKDLEKKVNEFLENNPSLSLTQLTALALEKFISEPNSIELVPISTDELSTRVSDLLIKHKSTFDKLK